MMGLVALVTILACGGAEAVLDNNVPVAVEVRGLNGAQPNDFFVSISPQEGTPNAPDALTTNQVQEWGSRVIDANKQRYTWRTISEKVPFQIYIGSADGQPHDFQVILQMEGVTEYSRTSTAQPGAPAKEARVFRNSYEANHTP